VFVNSSHTPGPWYVGCHGLQIITIDAKRDEPNGLITEVRLSGWCNEDEAKANARLIAAAPDLLTALEEMTADLISHASLGLNENEVAMLRRAEAAIAKAKGGA